MMNTTLNMIYAAIAALAISFAFEFTGPAVDYLALTASAVFVYLTNFTKEKTKRTTKRIIMPSVIASALAALLWWNAWMHQGFIGSPDYLKPLIGAFTVVDGEMSYDVELTQMYWISFMTFLLISLFLIKKSAYQVGGHNSGGCAPPRDTSTFGK